jgi:hypothetical protein
MLVRFQLLLFQYYRQFWKSIENLLFFINALLRVKKKLFVLILLVIITQLAEYPFVVRKVGGSIPPNYPQGKILVAEFWSPKPEA